VGEEANLAMGQIFAVLGLAALMSQLVEILISKVVTDRLKCCYPQRSYLYLELKLTT
jgi:hypothetical protein